MIRALAVTGVFLVAAGMGLPSGAPAQTPAQGQAVGILFLLGALRTGPQASAKAPVQKPKPGLAGASHEAEGRIAGVKQKPLPAKDGTVLVRMGSRPTVSIPDKVARPSDPLDGPLLRVTSDQKNGRKLDGLYADVLQSLPHVALQTIVRAGSMGRAKPVGCSDV